MTFDEYVQTSIPPEYHDIVAALRALMQDAAPEAKEGFSYNMPVWTKKHIIAYLTPYNQGITFSFTYGVGFEDKFGLLRGKAKNARFIKLKQVSDINAEALRCYIKQAVSS